MTLLNQNIFAHRGFWNSMIPQNSPESFVNASAFEFSIETDLRSIGSEIVISHDIPSNELTLNAGYIFDFNSRFALNIKSDGIFDYFLNKREWLGETKSFFFDGSIPELYKYKNAGLPIALRLSEFEMELPWECKTIWLDSFNSDWWIKGDQLHTLSEKHFVIVVSPELHGREYLRVWDKTMELILKGNDNIGICTDYPDKFAATIGARYVS
jgi:glycerophosphoryl diester phosphodiesterase